MFQPIARTCVVALIVLVSGPAGAEPTVADLQVVSSGPDAWVVRIRATEAQAFDVVTSLPTTTVVRLHLASLDPDRAPLDPTPFGSVLVTADDHGVDVRLDVLDASYVVKVAQGQSASIVELLVTRATTGG
ncbi:MAG: hypothetical protein ACT4QD_19920 [Acidobacteriota bacterium]